MKKDEQKDEKEEWCIKKSKWRMSYDFGRTALKIKKFRSFDYLKRNDVKIVFMDQIIARRIQ